MKIGIVSSGVDTLALFQFLMRYDNEYLIFCDQTNFPYGEKSFDYVLSSIENICDFLIKQGVDVIIMDPVYELSFKYLVNKDGFKILPLFQKYLHEYAFRYSLVGKIGIISDFGSFGKVQKLLENEEKDYILTKEQKSVKIFSYPFHYRVKSAGSWVMNINDLGVHNPYLIRTMKNDLRYFKDAYVDTILPMHFHYFRMQRSIKSFFNFHKTRFHDFSVLEKCFSDLTGKIKGNYGISVRINQSSNFLTRNKQLMWNLQRGKNVKVSIKEI